MAWAKPVRCSAEWAALHDERLAGRCNAKLFLMTNEDVKPYVDSGRIRRWWPMGCGWLPKSIERYGKRMAANNNKVMAWCTFKQCHRRQGLIQAVNSARYREVAISGRGWISLINVFSSGTNYYDVYKPIALLANTLPRKPTVERRNWAMMQEY